MIAKLNRSIILLLLIGITAYFVNLFEFPSFNSSETTNIFDNIPMSVGEWKGDRSVLEANVYKILETDAVFVARYNNNKKESVTLSIVYYPQLKVDFHKPEYCNTGRGDIVEIIGDKKIVLKRMGGEYPILTNTFLVRRENGRVDLFFYFYKTGNYITNKYIMMRYNMVKRYFYDKKSDASLTVISVYSVESIDKAMDVMNDFIVSILPELDI